MSKPEVAKRYIEHFYPDKSQPEKYVSVQVGLYVMELMLRSVKEAGRELELVLPIIFCNGKEKWQPLTLAELFAGHPQLGLLQPYIPNFSFVFEDVSQLSTEELLQLDLSSGAPSWHYPFGISPT